MVKTVFSEENKNDAGRNSPRGPGELAGPAEALRRWRAGVSPGPPSHRSRRHRAGCRPQPEPWAAAGAAAASHRSPDPGTFWAQKHGFLTLQEEL